MTIEQIYSNLCCYDDRNPDNNNEFIDMEELSLKGKCYCDNCFYGRTKLAEYIVGRNMKSKDEIQQKIINTII